MPSGVRRPEREADRDRRLRRDVALGCAGRIGGGPVIGEGHDKEVPMRFRRGDAAPGAPQPTATLSTRPLGHRLASRVTANAGLRRARRVISLPAGLVIFRAGRAPVLPFGFLPATAPPGATPSPGTSAGRSFVAGRGRSVSRCGHFFQSLFTLALKIHPDPHGS